jgi:hypothetical protein
MAAMIASDNNLAAACMAEDFHSEMSIQYFGQTWENANADAQERR